MNDRLTHLDEHGQTSMVDVSKKPIMRRTAIAEGFFTANASTLDTLKDGKLPKGEGLAVARIA